MQATKQNTTRRMVLSVTALVSGFVVWNIWNKKSKLLHEKAMKQLPHLVLHMDLNNTIIIDNLVTNLNAEDTVNSILAHTLRGNEVNVNTEMQSTDTKKDILNNKQWLPLQKPRDQNTTGSITYCDFIKINFAHLMQDGIEVEAFEKIKNHYLKHFTADGFSGAQFKPIVSDILSKYNSSPGFILTPFWNMIHDLKSSKIKEMGYASFSIIFRTFGTDSERVIHEFNTQCEAFGYHDLKIDMKDILSYGVFIHAQKDVSLILGTLQVPKRYDSLKEDMTVDKLVNVENMERITALKQTYNVKVLKGYKEIYNFMVHEMRSKKGCVAIRDEFVYWGLNKRQSDCGKPLCLDGDKTVHSLFFDDYADIIIDSRYMKQNGDTAYVPFCDIENICVVKCNTYDVLKDDHYFSKAIVRANLKWKQSAFSNKFEQ